MRPLSDDDDDTESLDSVFMERGEMPTSLSSSSSASTLPFGFCPTGLTGLACVGATAAIAVQRSEEEERSKQLMCMLRQNPCPVASLYGYAHHVTTAVDENVAQQHQTTG